MVDGLKCSCIGLLAEVWQNNPLLDFGLSVSESTGELLSQRKEAKRAGMRFVISPGKTGRPSCSMFGSLHKYKNNNDHNRDQFPLSEVIKTLDGLSKDYDIDLNKAQLHGLEIGVNIPLNYSPERIIKSAICHKGKAFDNLSRRGMFLGVICEHTDYAIKLYDKGHQSRIEADKYILRYEIKIKCMRMLAPYAISCLADLKDPQKIALVESLLLSKLAEVVFFDFGFNTDKLTFKQRLNWERYSNPKYWENLNRKQYYKARNLIVQNSLKYGAVEGGKILSKKVSDTFQKLIDIKHKTGGQFQKVCDEAGSTKKGTISELEYVSASVTFGDEKKQHEKDKKNEGKKRYCLSCGRDISRQRKDSVFCSEKYFGRQAKKCRNKNSNHRKRTKQKIEKAKNKKLRVQINYIDSSGNEKITIRQGNKIKVSRSWLDKVRKVTLLMPHQEKNFSP